ncbi:MAG: hypothetical protein R3B48_12880 [Kofleriaceae bacterium]
MKHLRSLRGFLAAAVVVAALASSAPARAEVGLGLFIGEPFGFDLKLDLQRNTSLDLLLGATTVRDGRANYGHLTYLVTPVVGRGRSVVVPLRLGIGGAFFDGGGDFAEEVNLAVRAPLEIGLRFRRAPLELYGEVAVKITFLDGRDNNATIDLDGGIGLRVML